ncbi:hypothetical protein ACHAXT_009235 [Thalassiosira profunda]
MASSEAVATYLNIVLYAVSYQLQRPVEPFLVRSLLHSDASNSNHITDEESAANRTYGRLTSFFSLIQTVGSPLVGSLLDRIGPKRTSISVYAGSALSYWILAHATTPGWLYLSKVPTLLQHAFLVGQATVASIPVEGEGSSARRAAALGRMTTAYTVGATVGPAMGGYLASSDLYAGARLAVWGSLISVLLSVVFLKDHTEMGKDESKAEAQQLRTQRSFLQSVHKTLSFLRHPTIGPLLFIKTFNGVSSSAFSTILPLILANKLHFSPAQLGYFMSASSISVALFAAVGISPAMRSVGNRSDRLAFMGIGCRLVAIIGFGLVASWAMSALAVETEEKIAIPVKGLVSTTLASVAVSLSSHMHATSLTTLTTGSVSAEERGAILGLEHGLFAMARIVGPPLGTALLSRGPSSRFLSELGADGLLRVIVACAVMDLLLMALLSVWSRSYGTTFDPNTDREVKPLVEDHDHSD